MHGMDAINGMRLDPLKAKKRVEKQTLSSTGRKNLEAFTKADFGKSDKSVDLPPGDSAGQQSAKATPYASPESSRPASPAEDLDQVIDLNEHSSDSADLPERTSAREGWAVVKDITKADEAPPLPPRNEEDVMTRLEAMEQVMNMAKSDKSTSLQDIMRVMDFVKKELEDMIEWSGDDVIDLGQLPARTAMNLREEFDLQANTFNTSSQQLDIVMQALGQRVSDEMLAEHPLSADIQTAVSDFLRQADGIKTKMEEMHSAREKSEQLMHQPLVFQIKNFLNTDTLELNSLMQDIMKSYQVIASNHKLVFDPINEQHEFGTDKLGFPVKTDVAKMFDAFSGVVAQSGTRQSMIFQMLIDQASNKKGLVRSELIGNAFDEADTLRTVRADVFDEVDSLTDAELEAKNAELKTPGSTKEEMLDAVKRSMVAKQRAAALDPVVESADEQMDAMTEDEFSRMAEDLALSDEELLAFKTTKRQLNLMASLINMQVDVFENTMAAVETDSQTRLDNALDMLSSRNDADLIANMRSRMQRLGRIRNPEKKAKETEKSKKMFEILSFRVSNPREFDNFVAKGNSVLSRLKSQAGKMGPKQNIDEMHDTFKATSHAFKSFVEHNRGYTDSVFSHFDND